MTKSVPFLKKEQITQGWQKVAHEKQDGCCCFLEDFLVHPAAPLSAPH
jgi:hypothetical protein